MSFKKAAVPSKKKPETQSLDRAYEKLCDAGRLDESLVAAGFVKGRDFNGVSVDTGTPKTTVHLCRRLTPLRTKKIDAVVKSHSAG